MLALWYFGSHVGSAAFKEPVAALLRHSRGKESVTSTVVIPVTSTVAIPVTSTAVIPVTSTEVILNICQRPMTNQNHSLAQIQVDECDFIHGEVPDGW